MRENKFSLNALVLIFIIAAVFVFLFIVILTGMADRSAINAFYRIEGTDLAVRYSNLEPDGIYEGSENVNSLKLKGTFGTDWGCALQGDLFYANEYRTSELGLMHSDLVRVDLTSFHKEILLKDTILRGRCASGELVCICDAMMPANFPKTNPLCALYAMSASSLRPEDDSATVLFLDPDTGGIVWSVFDENALGDDFDARYLARTLEEVRA